ncbi:MAG: hypothetical protein JSV28_06085 [Deltaproteobacteria bacterium]|jgi:hypothetical protein|nr:MAG: hypothetical protein JSV28_06085 [Deltaproteobacteria bacterium]
MHTYVDFITHVKGIEYIISVLTIVGFVLFLEILKPKPFQTLVRSTRDDLDHIRKAGYGSTFQTVKRMLSAPFIGLLYVLMLPFVFAYALGLELLRTAAEGFEKVLGMAGRTAFFGWRPMEAYLGGKKGRKKEKGKETETEEAKEKEGEEESR